MKTWLSSIAAEWMETNAHKYAVKAVGMGPDFTRQNALMEVSGVLFWGVINALGIDSREAFTKYMTEACGWSAENIKRSADTIETLSAEDLTRRKREQEKLVTPEVMAATVDQDTNETEKEIDRVAEIWVKAFYRASQARAKGTDTPLDLVPGVIRNLKENESVVIGFTSAESRTVPLFPGEEPFNVLVANLQEKGRKVSLLEVSAWSVMRRDVARAWLAQGGPPPDFLTACGACDRGEPYVTGREYLHTGEGLTCGKRFPIENPDWVPMSTTIAEPKVAIPKTTKKLKEIERPIPVCSECEGTGYASDATEAKCELCAGSGKVLRADTCRTCIGAGCDAAGEDCIGCSGTGIKSPLVPEEKRKRGRPPGSKNKKQVQGWEAAKQIAEGAR